MFSCKDCIHYGICLGAFGNWLPKPCDSFKNKSNFIELPCPIGSTVYMVVNAYNTWDDEPYRAVLPVQFKLDMLQSFNKRFFLTQKEAERKLEEILQ